MTMHVYDAYQLAIKTGMSKDLRPKDEVDEVIAEANAQYEALPDDRKDMFDDERLWNPYADTRFSACVELAKETPAECMMWGIDISSAEVLLADRLREKGKNISCLVAHHPLGTASGFVPGFSIYKRAGEITAIHEN